MSRHRKIQSTIQESQATFLEDLETSLLNSHDLYGIDAFEAVFNKKKLISQMIAKQKRLKQQAYISYIKAKQRVAQIQQLQGKVDKQTSLLQVQIQKINDAHNVAKLLMMEKIVRLQKQTQDTQKKRNQCYQIKLDHQRSSLTNATRSLQKVQRMRIKGLSRTIALKSQLQNRQFKTIQSNRRKAQSVRNDNQRRKGRMKRIQQFKLQRAQKNYLQKISNIQKAIQQNQDCLIKLSDQKQAKQKHLQATENVTQDYINSFFATATIQ